MKKIINIQEYINSGILEQYALGLTTAEQNVEIAQILKQYPELQKEFTEIESSLELFAKQYAKPMPAHLKDKIMTTIQNEQNKSGQLKNNKTGFNNFLFLAAIALLAISTFYFWKINTDSRKEIDQLKANYQELYSRHQSDSAWLVDCSNQLNDLKNKDRFRILLKGTPKSLQSFAAVYYDTISQRAFLDVMELPPTPPEKQYQLWAITSTGEPIDLGVIHLINKTTGYVRQISYVPDAVSFAITLEPKGGRPFPTLEQMYLIGGN